MKHRIGDLLYCDGIGVIISIKEVDNIPVYIVEWADGPMGEEWYEEVWIDTYKRYLYHEVENENKA